MNYQETDEDIANVEAWVEIIEDILNLIPRDKRTAVLQLASKNWEEESKKDHFRFWTMNDLANLDLSNWNVCMRLRSLIVQVLTRVITNDHSPEDAARLLFAEHRHGHGSGRLGDYIDDLPKKHRRAVAPG